MHSLFERALERSPRRLRPGVRLVGRTAQAAAVDRLPGLAAEIAFWAVLSLPALILTLVAAASAISSAVEADWQTQLLDRTTEVARVALTDETIQAVVRPLLVDLLEGAGVGLVSFGFVTTLWTASRAVRVVLTTLTIAYDRHDPRPAWKDRLLAFGLTFVALAVGTILLPLLLAGPSFGEQLTEWIGGDPLGVGIADLWRVAYWPATVVFATFAIAWLYHVGVPGYTPWRRDLPGAVLATAVWLLGSAGLRLYGIWIVDSDSVYGPLAGPIVALLWLWVTGLAVLLGAELNAQIDKLWPVETERPRVTARAVAATRRMLG